MLSEIEQYEVREKMMNSVRELLMGPGSEKMMRDSSREVISEPPSQRYVTGILYPYGEKNHEEISVSDHDVDVVDEETIVIDNEFKPRTMGLTVYFTGEKQEVSARVEFAFYEEIENPLIEMTQEEFDVVSEAINNNEKLETAVLLDYENIGIKLQADNGEGVYAINEVLSTISRKEQSLLYFCLQKLSNINGNNHKNYKRNPFIKELSIPLDKKYNSERIKVSDQTEVEIISIIKKLEIAGGKEIESLTLVLKNLSSHEIFQSKLTILKPDEGFEFVPFEVIKLPDMNKLSYDDRLNLLLYRNKKTYAVGHGTSVNWKIIEDESIPRQIETTYMPSHEISPMSFNVDNLDAKVLKPESYLVDSKEEQLIMLDSFVKAYDDWILKIEKKLLLLDSVYLEIASENVNKCKECSQRMRKTIDFLRCDSNAWIAFQNANEAMLLQRMEKSTDKEAAYRTKDYSEANFTWRPFQLAFVLNSLESILNEKSSEREILDLIWVPTGGGKTEAYLFAIAAVIFYRRLEYDNCDGVSVIMRYTLRLLTAQQFERAASLICACEYIRLHNEMFGEKEISVGLWVGGASTPNNYKDANESIDKMTNSRTLNDAKKFNSFQLLKCPWCNEDHSIIPKNENVKFSRRWGYQKASTRNDYHNIKCVNKDCAFEKLPIHVVDEAIYYHRPTLLFGTVDKFAQVPLKEGTEKLFGSDNPNKFRRPELIIQDELHLISGPLGSIVGLYEAGFDYVLGENTNPPKYIASTATIRNAEEQVLNIFDRTVTQFPPNGLDAEDNFFVKENYLKKGRKYLGIMATGKTQITAEVRLAGALLQSVNDLNFTNEEKELFWTVAGYFNSIRELGKASTLIKDDVKDFLSQLNARNNTNKRAIYDNTNVELTSRVSGTEIPDIISQLEIPLGNKGVLDSVIATNMLSVGVDIGRLNSMFVVGQPKLTSEYIQATSRVGRRSLGLVCTLYNSSRSRDRSHYETFQSYHQSLYRYVEPSSVTPFSVPSLEKAVAEALVTMVRNSSVELMSNESAGNVLNHQQKLLEAVQFLKKRIAKADEKSNLYLSDAEKLIDTFVRNWIALSEKSIDEKELMYYVGPTKSSEIQNSILLRSYDDKSMHGEATRVMGAMRNVEENAFLRIID